MIFLVHDGDANENDGCEESGGDLEEKEEEPDKNNLMRFVLQLECASEEDDKADIQSLWKKRVGSC